MASIGDILTAATRHLESGAIDDALTLAEQAHRRAPGSPRVLKCLGSCLMASGDLEAAAETFGNAVRIDPQDAASCYDYGLALHALGDIETALLQLERSLALATDNTDTHQALGALLAEKNDFDRAVRHLHIALELKPEDPGVLANYGTLLARIGAHYDARAHLQRAIEIEPRNIDAHVPLIQILHELDENAQAVSLAEKLYLDSPRNPLVLAILANALTLVGDYKRAGELIEIALQVEPDLLPAVDAFAQLCAYTGDPQRGIAKVAALLQRDRDNPHLLLSMASALGRNGQYADAVTLARTACDDAKTRSGAHALMRRFLSLQGRFEEQIDLGMELRGGSGATDSEPIRLVIPMELKVLDVLHHLRFVTAQKDGSPTAIAAIHAPDRLGDIFARLPDSPPLLPLEPEVFEAASTGGSTQFITEYATRARLLDYTPERFTPYLKADGRADAFWQRSLEPLKPPLVGIVWAKYPPAARLHDVDRALRDWPGTVISLVWDDLREELAGNERIIDAGCHLNRLGALVDLIDKLDLVVGPDSVPLHIAGALGVPGIVLETPEKSWYWQARDETAFWYPTVQVLERAWSESSEDFAARIRVASTAHHDPLRQRVFQDHLRSQPANRTCSLGE